MRVTSFLFALPLVACGGSKSPIPAECNPLGGEGCMLPWPSATYEVADPSTATGWRVDVPIEAMPANGDKISVDPHLLNRWDGFSPTGLILAEFPKGVSSTGLPTFMDPSASLAPDSPIVLLDMDTGERAPFFAEVDQNIAKTSPNNANLLIRPLARLHGGARYAVAITNAVQDANGAPLTPSPAFAAIVAGKSYDHPRFAALAKRYADIFSALATAGIDKHNLALAWDFTVASDQFLQSDLTLMSSLAVSAMANGAQLTFVANTQPNQTGILKTYTGTFKSPNFLTDGEQDDSIINRGSDGLPYLNGLRDANFAALIPACVQTQPLPRPVIVFGHGLFGSAASYLSNSLVVQLANEHCMIILAGDFIGLTSRQLTLAALVANDMNRGNQVSEKLAQSVIDFMALETITRTTMATSPEFSVNGQAVIDPTKVYYVGGSLGGIMGNVFMAYDRNITRGVLAVPGGVWSLLFERSQAWSLLQGSVMGSYGDPSVYELNIALFGMGMEPYDPITTAAHVIKDPLPNVPVKNILMWYTMGDCLVTNIATEFVARTMGIQLLSPATKMPWGLTPVSGPLVNGITVFNDHPSPLPPTTNIPPASDNGTHSGINSKPAALRFAFEFLFQDPANPTGNVVPECFLSGSPVACDCENPTPGACN